MATDFAALLLTQKHRFIRVKTPLGENALLIDSFDGYEHISAPFSFDLQLLSEKGDLELKTLIGQPAEVSILTAKRTERQIHGYITSFSLEGSDGGMATYRATLHSWLYALGLRINCRIFQKMTVLAIVEKVFKEYGPMADFEIKAKAEGLKPLTLTVQYNESDLDFVSRLLEAYGLYYYFKFSAGRHTLIIDSDSSSAQPMPEQPRIAFNKDGGASKLDTIQAFTGSRSAISSKYAIQTFDFKDPKEPMATTTQSAMNIGKFSAVETYEHAGAFTYADVDASQAYAKLRMEEMELQSKFFSGASSVRTLTCGHIFELTDHFALGHGDNAKFLVTSVRHSGSNNLGHDSSSHYENTFTCIRKAIPFRPGRRTPPPIMRGPQTAIVVGPKDEEIYCDKDGRVKIQFHWDREGQRNDQSSCFVRVATSWAGNRFGFISLPRIGTEVIVNFLEGDPDRPIITGAVYNQENMPPWDLPTNKTQSGIATRSSKTGGFENANALRFEDKQGEEEVWLHAEKDQRIEVEHDEKHDVGNDRTKTIGHDESTTVGNNRTEKVGVHEDITIGANRTEMVGANETITIGANRTETVLANETVTISGNQSLTVLMTKNENITLTDTQQVGLAKTTTVGGAYALTVGLGKNEAVGLMSAEEVGLNKTTMVGKSYNISVADELTITVGKSQLSMKKDGTISISGANITIDGSGPVQINGNDIDLN